MKIRKFLKSRRGQSATEYMLVLAVIVLGLVAAASRFIDPFKAAVGGLATNVATWLTTNQTMTGAGG